MLVDDLLLSPFTSLLWLFREIHDRAQQERASEAESVTYALTELYMKLETKAITEEEFAAEETRLLDRLDAIREREEGLVEEEEEAEEDVDDDEGDVER